MVAKVLAGIMLASVLSLGGFAYYHNTGCCPLTGNCLSPAADQSSAETPPCCQTPSRTSCFTLTPGEDCCADVDFNAASTEVLTIQPREVQ